MGFRSNNPLLMPSITVKQFYQATNQALFFLETATQSPAKRKEGANRSPAKGRWRRRGELRWRGYLQPNRTEFCWGSFVFGETKIKKMMGRRRKRQSSVLLRKQQLALRPREGSRNSFKWVCQVFLAPRPFRNNQILKWITCISEISLHYHLQAAKHAIILSIKLASKIDAKANPSIS